MGLIFKAKNGGTHRWHFLSGKNPHWIAETMKLVGPATRLRKTLASRLRQLPLRTGRFKNRTPPRIDSRTINFNVMERQDGDTRHRFFLFLGHADQHPRKSLVILLILMKEPFFMNSCRVVESPLYTGVIEG